MSNFNDRIEINTSTSVIVLISKTSLDNHLLPGIYFYINHLLDVAF